MKSNWIGLSIRMLIASSLSIALVVVLITVFINTSSGSSEAENASPGFKTYTNDDYGIKIEYPSKWKKSEQDLASHVIVQFTAPDAKDGSQTAGLLVANYGVNDTSLDNFINVFFNDRYESPSDYKLISSSDTNFAGMAAREFILYDYNKVSIPGFSDSTSTDKVMRIFAVDNNTKNGYAVKYWTQPSLFDKYMSTAQKMIDSFGVTNLSAQNVSTTFQQNIKSQAPIVKDNSPFTDLENKFNLRWGSLGSGSGQFHEPKDLAINSLNGLLYVADSLNNRIQVFDTDGNYISEWGQQGVQDGQFRHPGNIGVSPWGDIYVTDTENGRIQSFNSNGTLLSKWGESGTEQGQFNFPGDLTFEDSTKSVFVTDTGNNRIQKFSSDGTFLSMWGSLGTGDGQLNHPAGISFDDINDVLYVADTNNDRIQQYDSNGTFISNWGTTGNKDGEFKKPTNIVLDVANKVVYVADTNNHRIQKFDSKGNYISRWGTQGIGNSEFSRPTGLDFEPPNTIYVADQINNNVQTFSSSIKAATSSGTIEEPQVENEDDAQFATQEQAVSAADLSAIPDILTVSDGGNDNDLPLVIALSDDQVSSANNDISITDYSFDISDWNPKFTFQFVGGSEISLVNVKQVLIGQIKKYSSPEDPLEDALLWRNIPLNQEVVLKLPDKGPNFMIVQAQFGNGATGIYSGAFDLDTFLSKSDEGDLLKDDLKENRDLKVMKSSNPNLDENSEFWQVSQQIVCDDLKEYGFNICQ